MEHKSKDEIYNTATLENIGNNPTGTRMDVVYAAMDRYAQQVAISFAEWIDKGWESVRLGEYQGKYSGEIKTTAELYTLFLTHKSI